MVEFILFDTPTEEVFLEGVGVTENLVMKYLADLVCGISEGTALKRLLAAAHVTDMENCDRVRAIVRKFSEPRPRKLVPAA